AVAPVNADQRERAGRVTGATRIGRSGERSEQTLRAQEQTTVDSDATAVTSEVSPDRRAVLEEPEFPRDRRRHIAERGNHGIARAPRLRDEGRCRPSRRIAGDAMKTEYV